jgi:hypothetical protein
MHCAFWQGPAPTNTAVRNRAAQQVSIWLSALRRPARHRAAPKCHTPSPHGFLSFGSQRITAARASFSCASQGAIDDSTRRSPYRLFTALAWSGTIPSSHTKGNSGMHRSNACKQGTARCGSSAGPSRPSLTWRSTGTPILGIASPSPRRRPLT